MTGQIIDKDTVGRLRQRHRRGRVDIAQEATVIPFAKGTPEGTSSRALVPTTGAPFQSIGEDVCRATKRVNECLMQIDEAAGKKREQQRAEILAMFSDVMQTCLSLRSYENQLREAVGRKRRQSMADQQAIADAARRVDDAIANINSLSAAYAEFCEADDASASS